MSDPKKNVEKPSLEQKNVPVSELPDEVKSPMKELEDKKDTVKRGLEDTKDEQIQK